MQPRASRHAAMPPTDLKRLRTREPDINPTPRNGDGTHAKLGPRSFPGAIRCIARRNMRRRRTIAVTIIIWLLGCASGIHWLVTTHVQESHNLARSDFAQSFDILDQRLNQNEVLLTGLTALLRLSRPHKQPELRQYANHMLARYPHLYTVGYQPLVEDGERDAFEQRMSRELGRSFRIRDFSFESDRTWRVSPRRSSYYPVTFMAPELANAAEVIGYDVYSDPVTRKAVDESATRSKPVAASPFDLVEGGRGYIFLQAITSSETGNGRTALQTPAQHLISLLVHADNLMEGMPLAIGAVLTLRHSGVQPQSDAMLGRRALASGDTGPWAWLPALPRLQLHQRHASAIQPIELQMETQPEWNAFHWSQGLMALVGWTLLVLAGYLGSNHLRHAKQETERASGQARQALKDLSSAEERAQTRRASVLSELGASFAHELNQPLTAVVAYSQAALRLLQGNIPMSPEALAEIRHNLQANTEQALRAGDLLTKLRALVRPQNLERKAVALEDIVQDALRLEQSRLDALQAQIVIRTSATPAYCTGDAVLLEQVFANLLRNAAEAMSEQPPNQNSLWVEISHQATEVRVDLRDTGPGMNDQQLSRAFHPFQSTKPNGLGMGLVICETIVSAHGGEIFLARAAEGGTQVSVRLPALNREYEARQPSSNNPTQNP